MTKRIRLAFMASQSPSVHSIGGWRHPRSYRRGNWWEPGFWEQVAQVLEKGCFDMLFFGDQLQLHDEFGNSPDVAIRYAVQFPRMDPMPFIPLMARATRRIGFGVTSSTAYTEPYYFARLMATLDHLSEGRVGWNIVASYGRAEARMLGRTDVRSHEDRYARAEEYAGLCYRLWRSWQADAVVMDRESGVYADPQKIEKFTHDGAHFHSQGPLSVPRSPQEVPLIIQAGASSDGLAFAGRHAEVHFAIRGSAAGMKQHAANFVKSLADAGRAPDAAKILWGTALFVAETAAEAKAKERAVVNGVPAEAGLALLSGQLGIDLSKEPLDEPIRNLDPAAVKGIQGIATVLKADFGDDYTIRDAARFHGAGMSALRISGSPEQVADRMEELLETGGGDGFMIRPHTLPGAYEDFVDLVIPVLQARGRVQRRYAGRTLRENIFSE
jgi:FMN-dependent oxidoreductase (nitrilotriacetate monooxygenase family)